MTPTDPNKTAPADGPVFGVGIDFTDPNSPLAPFYLNGSQVLAVVVLALTYAALSYFPLWHTDVWGHLRFGASMIQNGRLPEREEFSGDFADQSALYINYQWVAQAGAYLVYDLGSRLAPATADPQEARDRALTCGAALLTTAHYLIVVLRLGVSYVALRRLTGSDAFALVGMLLAPVLAVFNHLLIIRPQILGELAFAALLVPLSRPELSRRAVALIPLVMILWTNCHGSFPVGIVLLGLFGLGQALEVARTALAKPPTSWPRDLVAAWWRDTTLRRLALALVLSVAGATLVNPHGPALIWHSWQLSKNPNIQTLEEWKPLPVQVHTGYLFLASVLALVPLLRWSRRRWTATQVLLLAAFGWQTLAHVRMLVWWCMVYAWVVTPHVQSVVQRFLPRAAAWSSVPSFRKTLLAAVLGVQLSLLSMPGMWLLQGLLGGALPLGARVYVKTPVELANRLRAEATPGEGRRRCVFASETEGDFLLWDLRDVPSWRVSCYTHVHLITEEHWEKCRRIKFAEPGWEKLLDELQAQYLVVDRGVHTRLAEKISNLPDRWSVLSPAGSPLFIAQRRGASK